MNLSGWTRLWIVAGAVSLTGCGQPTASESMTMANSAIAHVQALQGDLRAALTRIEELERKVEALEAARAAGAKAAPPSQAVIPDFVFDTPPTPKKSSSPPP